MRRTDIFLHIPKTGGTTIHSALTFQYMGKPSVWLKPWKQSENVYERRVGKKLDEMDMNAKRKLRLVRGHVYYGVHNKIPNKCLYFGILRNPIKHVRSQYKYFGKVSRQKGERSPWTEKTFREILGNDESPWLDNMQVRWVSGVGLSVQTVTEKHYEKALRNIGNGFAAIGVTERFDTSLVLFAQKLGWNRPLFYRRAKVQTYHGDDDLQLENLPEAAIRSRNKWDMKLYQHAVESVAQAETEEVRRQVRRLRTVNKVLGPFVDLLRSIRHLVRRLRG
jgi:hypothetical protein